MSEKEVLYDIGIVLANPNLKEMYLKITNQFKILGYSSKFIVGKLMTIYNFEDLDKSKIFMLPLKKRRRGGQIGYIIGMLLAHFEINRKLPNKIFNTIIVFTDSTGISKLMLVWAKKRKIPVICIQEGITVSQSSPAFKCNMSNFLIKMISKVKQYGINELFKQGLLGLFSDYNIVYGHAKKNILIDAGFNAENIYITGNPIYDEIRKQEIRDTPKSFDVLYIHQPLRHNFKLEEKYWYNIAKSCSFMKDSSLIFKIHPRSKFTVEDIKNKINSYNLNLNFNINKELDAQELVNKAGVVITSHSTVIYRALIEGIPLILLKGLQSTFDLDIEKFKAGVVVSNPEELLQVIPNLLNNSVERIRLREGINNAIDYHLYKMDGNASKRVGIAIQNIFQKSISK